MEEMVGGKGAPQSRQYQEFDDLAWWEDCWPIASTLKIDLGGVSKDNHS